MDEWMNDLRYLLMPCRTKVAGYETEYDLTYQMWRKAWEKFRSEIGVSEKLSSDGFLLPDEMGVLFLGEEPVGMCSFTYGTLEMGPMPDLSWFRGWTEEAYQQLRGLSTNAVIASQFTVSPAFTGKNQLVRWKQIIFLYTFMRFEASIADVMAGHINLTRKVEEACGEKFGATVLDSYRPFNYLGVAIPAQLVAYEKKNIPKLKSTHTVEICEELWSRRIHLTNFPVIQAPLPFRKAA